MKHKTLEWHTLTRLWNLWAVNFYDNSMPPRQCFSKKSQSTHMYVHLKLHFYHMRTLTTNSSLSNWNTKWLYLWISIQMGQHKILMTTTKITQHISRPVVIQQNNVILQIYRWSYFNFAYIYACPFPIQVHCSLHYQSYQCCHFSHWLSCACLICQKHCPVTNQQTPV